MTLTLATRPGLALLLGLLCLGLGVIVYRELDATGGEVAAGPAPVAAGAAPPLPPQPASAPLPPLEAFAEVVRRPLFSPTRQPPSEAVKDTQGNAGNFALLGIIISNGVRVALLQHGRPPATARLKEGQGVDGWTIQSILPDRVVLQNGAAEQEIKLKDRPQQPPQPPQPRQPARAEPPPRGERG